jgi:hypothetical protein
MAAGQAVEIEVDSTGKTYHGKITQIGGATGSVLSLFPPENATGNYVKVVQRVPVRIDFTDLASEDPNHELRPGLSVEPKVRVKMFETLSRQTPARLQGPRGQGTITEENIAEALREIRIALLEADVNLSSSPT